MQFPMFITVSDDLGLSYISGPLSSPKQYISKLSKIFFYMHITLKLYLSVPN